MVSTSLSHLTQYLDAIGVLNVTKIERIELSLSRKSCDLATYAAFNLSIQRNMYDAFMYGMQLDVHIVNDTNLNRLRGTLCVERSCRR